MRKKFFIAKLRTFLILILVPICIIGLLLVMFIYIKVKDDAENNSTTAIDLMNQSMDYLVRDLDYYRVSIDYDASLHVAIISSLMNSEMTYETSTALRQAMQYLNFSSSAKPYIHSIYVTMHNSPYVIQDGVRKNVEHVADKSWKNGTDECRDKYYIEKRSIKRSKIDRNETEVVTFYQNMKYHEVLIINVVKAYFDHLLDSIGNFDNQVLLVLDENGQILFSNKDSENLSEELIRTVNDQISKGELSSENIEGYFFNATEEKHFGLRYVSMVPVEVVMRLPNLLIRLILWAIIASLILTFFLAYYFTERDYRQIYQIIEIFDKAEKGDIVKTHYSENENAYFRIINNVINLFISKTYLNTQLEAKKYSLLAAQLSALQYQLNPHFLFNTLQAIDLEVMKIAHGPSAANEMIGNLSALLRYSLENPTELVTVSREIDMTKCYIAIQKRRFGDLFVVTWEVDECSRQKKMLKMILQPIIENAITHFDMDAAEKLWIKVKIYIRGEYLYITVIDNGNGIEKEQLERIREKIDSSEDVSEKHIGLKNIAQRIKMGMDGTVRIKSKKHAGTIVEIKSKL